jgi:hypothetical protein
MYQVQQRKAASVELVVRKFIDGNDNYRRALHAHVIDIHPDKERIIILIERRGVDYYATAVQSIPATKE